ncbi:hypothetical protein ACFE04_010822 [Oxalis oulophora]
MDQLAMTLGESLLSAALSRLVDEAASSDLLKVVFSNVKIGSKLEQITIRLEQIVKYKNDLGLMENSIAMFEERQPTTSLVDQSRVHGRDVDKERIVQLLLGVEATLLQEKLKEKLSTRKFLIVVDDLWNENVDNWESLCHPFRTGVVGCKLLVTTRNESVLSTLGATSVYRLGDLSREDSLSLFESYALGKETFDKLPTLKDIGSSSKMMALIPSCCTSYTPRVVFSNVKIGSKLEQITIRLEQIVKYKNHLGLMENSIAKFEERQPTTSLVDHSPLLQEKLKEKLSTKKFLIVVDDLWNENVDNWESLCHPFRTGVVGCKLLVTTRNESVVSTLDAASVYRLGYLSREDSLSLLESYALGKETFDQFPSLKDIEIKNLIKLHKLDLAYTQSLQEMPSGISSLTNLHTLSKFIVGMGNNNSIRELQGLTRLRGKLSIYGLDNVQDVKDVSSANLQGKEGLNDITLIWSDGFYDSRDEALEMKVLDLLEPNENLKVLQIESYGGNHFSSWLGNHRFANMERINLLRCKKSKSLPSLGELPLLKYLRIEGMDRVERVDREFYGSKCFPNLETLEFENMLNWSVHALRTTSDTYSLGIGQLGNHSFTQ